MVNPVTGPFTQEQGRDTVRYFWSRTSRRQAKPYNLRLPFSFESQRRTYDLFVGSFDTPTFHEGTKVPLGFLGESDWASTQSRARDLAQAKAFKKFQAQLGDPSQLMVSILERRKSIEMIANRADAIRKGFEAIRRGKPPVDWKRDTKVGSAARAAKDAGAKYLEYHFGWEPMVKDIYSAIQVLQSPVPPSLVKASGQSGRLSWGYTPLWGGLNGVEYGTRGFRTTEVSCQLIADVAIENPLLWRANQLGLTNPLSWAWELTRLSWLINWFATTREFVDGFTAFQGLALTSPATTYFERKNVHRWRSGYNHATSFERLSWELISVTRTQGISGPALRLKPFKGLSVSRAVTSIAYLLQFLRSIK